MEYAQLHPTNDAFVDALYQDVLGRADNPSEHAAALAALNGGASRSTLALGVVFSTEARQQLAEGFYETFLQRAGGAAELQSVEAALLGGTSDTVIATVFASSSEFTGNAAKAVP